MLNFNHTEAVECFINVYKDINGVKPRTDFSNYSVLEIGLMINALVEDAEMDNYYLNKDKEETLALFLVEADTQEDAFRWWNQLYEDVDIRIT